MGELAASDHIIQGEYRISNRPDSVLTTLLGSCVAACLWDPALKIGGMNHFLLPGEDELRGGPLREASSTPSRSAARG
jgi:chemotaxis protein CheD